MSNIFTPRTGGNAGRGGPSLPGGLGNFVKVPFILAGVFALAIIWSGFTTIDQGNVGVKLRFGQAIDTLHAPYPERILRTFRAALGATDDPTEQADHVLRIIRELGLQPYEAPEPLPEITDDDLHLVCWLALVPSHDPAGRPS